MKCFLIVLMLVFLKSYSFGQDTIVKMNKAKICADVFEITEGLIKFIEIKKGEKRFSIIKKRHVDYIIYSNGQIEFFPKAPKPPSPHELRMKRETETN